VKHRLVKILKFTRLNMDNQASNNDKENVSPATEEAEVDSPKIYTVESEFVD
jgi:hypothetical protein